MRAYFNKIWYQRMKKEKIKIDKKLPAKDENKLKTKRKHLTIEDDTKKNWRPQNFEQVLENIKKMRELNAPVDTMGCDQCHDKLCSESEQRFQILVALMLSSQTRDQMTHATMSKLRNKGLSLDYILQIDEKKLAELIKPVSFYNIKAKNLKKTAQILKENFNGDIPKSAEQLCKLPGVGPKMAYLAMQTAWDKIEGIGVDTHVHRITNRLGWVRKPTKNPESTRLELESWLPKHLWKEINHLLVGFGQTICLPRFPKCNECLNNQLCPFAFKKA